MTHQIALNELLQKTSRSFALTIPLLPEPTRQAVAVAYLLFRIADTFEDATHWAREKRIEALSEFIELMLDSDTPTVERAAVRWLRDPPLAHSGYLELLRSAPRVLEWHRELASSSRDAISEHLIRTARGMSTWTARTDPSGSLCLRTLGELREYCYTVAGIVGELLTELYLDGESGLDPVATGLRERSTSFGEGLQLVNILKDAQSDAAEGRIYLPRELPLGDVYALARQDLATALEYCELLRHAGAHVGVVAFNALNARLALETLRVLHHQGSGSKLSRHELEHLTRDVMHSINSGGSLAPMT